MGVCLEKSTLTKSTIDNKPNIYLVEQRKNNEDYINSNRSKEDIDFFNSNDKKNKIIDENEDKYFNESNILNIKQKKLNDKNVLENTEENNDNSLKSKISIKSQHILKKILLNLEEKKKLLLIKYNKYYHKIMKINMENYKKVSGKIKIGGINGYGKEYELNELTLKFEGYYKNGKRNGKGIEYNDDIKYEGEYINGIKNGKGYELNYETGSLFEGEYLNGKKWKGIIKEY